VEERRFEEVDVDNFDQHMAQIGPELNLQVRNVLTNDKTMIDVDLRFDSMSSFEPGEVVKRIPELSIMLDARKQLKELLTYMDGKAAAEDVIQELLKNPRWSQGSKDSQGPAPASTNPEETKA
jgi:type VI secretion system protein ImpB